MHDLGKAYRKGRLDRQMRIYLAPKVLIIDEMGYLPVDELRGKRGRGQELARYC